MSLLGKGYPHGAILVAFLVGAVGAHHAAPVVHCKGVVRGDARIDLAFQGQGTGSSPKARTATRIWGRILHNI